MSRARDGQAEEIHRLQGCLNNLISVLALPALWGGGESARIVATLLEGLLGMLRLDFAYARLNDTIDGAPSEIIRLQKRKAEADAEEVGRMLAHWLPQDTSISPQVVAIPSEEGKVSVAALRLGLADEMGVLVAGSLRADFPTQMELLLLQVGVNQAVIGLQEARRLSGQKETAKELEQRVAERTAQLTAANEELTAANEEVRRETAERQHTEEERLKLASLVENSSDFIGLAALDGRMLYVNRAGQEMVGMVGDERVRASRILDYVGEDEAERVQKQILPAVTRDGRWEGETSFRNFQTGDSIPMHQHVFLIKDPLRDLPVALATISRNITERKQEERELMDLKDELAVELTAMTRLHELSMRVLASTELQPLLEEVLDATIALQSADFGLVQRYNPAIGALEVVAQRGFQRDSIESFGGGARDGGTFYDRALERGARVLSEDVQTDPGFEPYRDSAASAGFRAVQSTPLFSRSGEPLGVISTHFRRPHRASDRDLRLTDLYAGQAVELIELRRAEEELRKVNERIESILQSTTDNCFGLSSDWRFTYLNEHAAEQMKILGKDPAALIGKVLWDEFPHVSNEAALRRVMSERVPVTDELYYASLGEWIENHMYPSADGGLVTFQKVITERKRAEEALRASEERFRRYFDLGLIGMAITSPTKGCIEVNDELCRILGYERSELLQKTWAEITHPDDLGADVAQFDRVMAGKFDGYTLDKRWIRKDGRVIHTIVAAQCLRRGDGSVDYFVGLVQDVTERKRAEEKLRRSEANLAEGQRISHTGSWAWNARSEEMFCSRELLRIFGLAADAKPTHDDFLQAIHPEDQARGRDAFDEAVRSRTDYDAEYRIVRSDRSVRHIHNVARPVVNESGTLIELVGTAMDITERRQAEEALHKARTELAHVTRVTMMGELAASIAHEVNQPLAAVVANGHACARWLAAEPPNMQEANDAVQRIVREANRASDVISRIRTFLRRGEMNRIEVDVDELIEEVVELVQGEVARRNVSLRTASAVDLPRITGDRVQLQQVLLNLVMNAIEAMSTTEEGKRVVHIGANECPPDALLVSVQDAGVGLDPERREHIFDAFYSTKPGGMGMGLAISRSIVEAHGGRLWATANEIGGETFHFTLPTTTPSS